MDAKFGLETDESDVSSSSVDIGESEQIVRKKRRRPTNDSSWKPLDSDNGAKRMPGNVTRWTMSKVVKEYGLHYEHQSSSFSDFYDIFSSPKERSKRNFMHPLHDEWMGLCDALINQTNLMIDKYGIEKDEQEKWSVFFSCVDKMEECVETVRNLTRNIPQGHPMFMRSHFALIDFYHALNDHFQDKIYSYNSSTDIAEESYTELLSKFLKIFLLTPRRGMKNSVLEIAGRIESIPRDLYLTVDAAFNLFSIQVNRAQCKFDKSVPFNINESLSDEVLVQHAKELLIDFQKSVIGDLEAVFGIICMQTSLIFTCLKILVTHYEHIQEYGKKPEYWEVGEDNCCTYGTLGDNTEEEDDGNDEKRDCDWSRHWSNNRPIKLNPLPASDKEKTVQKSGTISYTRPFDYLVSKDRREIMEFLFWIGINAYRKFIP